MDQHVFLEVRGYNAGEFTLCAAEGFFPLNGSECVFEVTIVCAGIVALCANERLFSRMCQHVPLQLTSFF